MIRTIHILLPLLLLLTGCRTIWISDTTPTIAGDAAEAELPAEIDDGWIIVEATINGHGPYRFILDTGAVYGVLGTELAESLGVEPSFSAWIRDSGGVRARYQVGLADEAVSGPLTLTRVPFIITDNLQQMFERQNADGMLGYPGFDRLTLDLDYPAGAVRVSTRRLDPREAGVIPLRRIHSETPKVRVSLIQNERQGPSRWMAIDSGGELFISFDTAAGSHWTHAQLAGSPRAAAGLAGPHHARSAPLRGDLLIAGTRVSGLHAKIDKPNNLLGHELLRHFRVRIDNRAGLAAFTPAASTIAMPPPGTLGITGVARLTDSYLILSIARDSPAERAGLLPGDLVWSIDGVPVETGGVLILEPDPNDPPVVLTIDRDEVMLDLTLTPEPLFPALITSKTPPRKPDLTLPGVRIVITDSHHSLEIDTPDGTITLPAAEETPEP